ncbi:hypothetical protein AWB75_04147 [Caballeronia catudaia]|uniref:Uncharacterized protein n=1 Tax=Caballeronia catudaia TaxID=1777136 RepID=A0A158BWI7_9BURK|nr:hypothetical protein [Caballeronia catudaia]SAK74452.1 hypothetical protein AWB75_04147 [Caballeronia catudaia]
MTERIKLSESETDLVATGHLLPLWVLGDEPTVTRGLPRDMPVLKFPVAPYEASLFPGEYENASFDFGRVPLVDGNFMTIRFQMDDLQVYWVAQMTDPEVWSAIDCWRRVGKVIILFDVHGADGSRRGLISCVDFEKRRLANEKFRYPERAPTVNTWNQMATLVRSGLLQLGATSDIEGVPLRHVRAGVLMTEGLEAILGKTPLVTT